MRPNSIRFLVTIVAGVAACADTPVVPTDVGGDNTANMPGQASTSGHVLQALTCSVRAGSNASFSCVPVSPAGGDASALIVGGQDVYVHLGSEDPELDGDTVVVPGVEITNLMVQKLGTSDGESPHPDHIRVFFQQLPTNGVEVANATGTDTFLESDQPYFEYVEEPYLRFLETSGFLSWKFDISDLATPEDTSFTFGVLVSAAIPHEDGVLLFHSESFADLVGGFNDVHGTSDFAVAVGSNGRVRVFESGDWQPAITNADMDGRPFFGVLANSPDDIWIVGARDPVSPGDSVKPGLHHYDADNDVWNLNVLTPDVGSSRYSDIGSSPSHATRFITRAGGVTRDARLTVWNGTQYIEYALPDSLDSAIGLRAVHGVSDSEVWMAGDFGYVFRATTTNGWQDASDITWEAFDLASELGFFATMQAIWVTDPTEVWVGGSPDGQGVVIRGIFDEGDWTWTRIDNIDFPDGSVTGIWAPLSNYVWYTTESGYVAFYDGDSPPTVFDPDGLTMEGIYGADPDHFWAVGGDSKIALGTR